MSDKAVFEDKFFKDQYVLCIILNTCVLFILHFYYLQG